MARRRGGYQRPAKPAAVSGPGALSQRTDGNVPKMLPTGGDYGDRKALAEQQSAAPMSSPSSAPGGGGPSPAAAARAPGSQFGGSAFSPTGRPGEPLTAGIDWGAGPGGPPDVYGEDPYLLAKALYALAPSPQLERLIARMSRA